MRIGDCGTMIGGGDGLVGGELVGVERRCGSKFVFESLRFKQ